MAGLEFKSFKALNAAKFEEIIVRDSGAFFGRMDAREEGDDPDSTETLNVSTILSQATHYVMKFKTPFVALFDYNTLIRLVMKNTQTVQPKTKTTKAKARGYGGDFAYMTVVKNSNQMRSAMLGFLLSAHLERENDDSWHKSANGTDILIDPSNLPSMGPSGAPGSRALPDRTATKRSYKERNTSESEGGSQSSQNNRASLVSDYLGRHTSNCWKQRLFLTY
ncbi:hypothetical protein diail_787 [Diaporthe ilicicola]|nr:hypothetical protein diail_787 [Diaporthe ilicicola]